MKLIQFFRCAGMACFLIIAGFSGFACVKDSSHIPFNKNPVIEEMVGKVSLRSIIEMHDQLVSFETRNTFSDTLSETRGIGAARRWIYSKFMEFKEANGGRLQVYYDAFDQPIPNRLKNYFEEDTYHMMNVVAMLPGKTDDIRYIVGGHYDSSPSERLTPENFNAPAPGADDDASGTIVTMELARVLSQYEFDHTLMFVAFVAEEKGLLGSGHMAQTAVDEGWDIGAVIGDDIVGNIRGGNGIREDSYVRVFSPDPIDSKSRNWARYIKQFGEPYVPDLEAILIFRLDRFGRGGDHSRFVRRGFAGVRFSEPFEDFAHQHNPDDRIEFVSREYMTEVARLQTAVLGTVANAPGKVHMLLPSRDRATYKTNIQWTHDTDESDIAGYKIYMRPTDSGYWQEVQDVGMVEKKQYIFGEDDDRSTDEGFEVKLDLHSIDDFVFGVSAYDKDGYESIVATFENPGR